MKKSTAKFSGAQVSVSTAKIFYFGFFLWQLVILCLSVSETYGLHCSSHFTLGVFKGSSNTLSPEVLSICIHFSQKYHPLNTRWHRWPSMGLNARPGTLDTFEICLFHSFCDSWQLPPGASPPHSSLHFATNTSLFSCFIFQQAPGQNKLKSSPNLINPGSTLVNTSEKRSHNRLKKYYSA